jgi:hypothetical protein
MPHGKTEFDTDAGHDLANSDAALTPREIEHAISERETERRRLSRQRFWFHLLSFLFGFPGIVLLAASAFLLYFNPVPVRAPGLWQVLSVKWLAPVGSLLLLMGVAFGSVYKRYHPAWMLLGLGGILGLVILACLPDQKRKRLAYLRERMLDLRDLLDPAVQSELVVVAVPASALTLPSRRAPDAVSVQPIPPAVRDMALPVAQAVPAVPVLRAVRRQPRANAPCCPFCGCEVDPISDSHCLDCAIDLSTSTLQAEVERLCGQRTLDQVKSFLFGLPGLGLAVASAILFTLNRYLLSASLFAIAGGVLLWVGIYYSVAYKRYNRCWTLLGLLGLIGLLAIVFLPDEKGRRLRRMRAILRWRRDWAPAEARRR